MKKGEKLIYKDGEWVEGKASPILLDEELCKLPSEFVTTTVEEADKIHPDDPLHTRLSMLDELEAKANENPIKDDIDFDEVPCGDARILYQKGIDVVRMRVLKVIIDNAILLLHKGSTKIDLRVKHLWFPENNLNIYELREGNPPPDSERPKHMRGFRLELDVTRIPQTVVDKCEARGVIIPDVKDLYPRYFRKDGKDSDE
jgi:hypothetical protein